MYEAPEDVVIENNTHFNPLCDWCDSPAVASVAVYQSGRTLSYDDNSCTTHLDMYFGPRAGRVVTDHREVA